MVYQKSLIMGTTENKVQNEVCKYLRKKRVFFFRVNNMPVWDKKLGIYRSMGEYSIKGVPDVLAVSRDGRMIGIEFKSKTGRLSADQFFFSQRLMDRGGEYHVIRSIEDIKELDKLW